MQSYPSAVQIPTIGLEERRKKSNLVARLVLAACAGFIGMGVGYQKILFLLCYLSVFLWFFLNGIRTQQQALLNCYKDLLV